MMTPTTLQALRRLLFFTQPEAAALIGGVSVRSWKYWEDGGRAIPADVESRIRDLLAWRSDALRTADAAIAAGPASTPPMLVIYGSADDWATLPGRDPVLWKPHCSVIAELCARHGAIAVPFDYTAFTQWLAGREDSEALRGAWAAQRAQIA